MPDSRPRIHPSDCEVCNIGITPYEDGHLYRPTETFSLPAPDKKERIIGGCPCNFWSAWNCWYVRQRGICRNPRKT